MLKKQPLTAQSIILDLKDKIANLQLEIKKKSDMEENFNQEIEELNEETQSLVTEIEKWQT